MSSDQEVKWSVNTSLNQDSTLRTVATTSDSVLLTYEDGVADIFEHNDSSRDLVRKGHFKDDRIKGNNGVALIPNTSTIVFRVDSKRQQVIVFDLLQSKVLFENDVGEGIYRIECSSKAIVVNCNYEILLYSFDGREVKLLNEFYMHSRLSSNGIFIYQPTIQERIGVHNAHTNEEIGSFAVDFYYTALAINDNGRIAAIQYGKEKLALYDLEKQAKIFECKTEEFGCLAAYPISDCGPFLSLQWEHAITILKFNTDPDGKLSLDFANKLENEDKFHYTSARFRLINGEVHYQFVTENGTLRIYKFIASEKRWELLV